MRLRPADPEPDATPVRPGTYHAGAGFTLLELLVAMTLLGLLGVMAADGLRFGVAVWERGAAEGEAAATTRRVAKLLGRLVADARPVRLRDGSREPAVLFEGAEDAMVFAAPLPAAVAPAGERLVALTVEPAAKGRRLVLRAAPLGEALPDLAAAGPPEPLLSGLAGARFAFLDAEAPGGPRWRPRWSGRARLPDRVAVTLEWPEDAGRPPLRVLARPRAEGMSP